MTYDIESYKKILAKLLKSSLENTEPIKELIEQMFSDEDFIEQAKNMCDAYMLPSNRSAKLISKSVDIRALPSIIQSCKRKNLGIIPVTFASASEMEWDEKIYHAGDIINVLVLSTQLDSLKEIILEEYAANGIISEIKREIAFFTRKTNSENPFLEIKDVDEITYRNMKKYMDELPSPLKFTMFPERNEKGKINVGFYTKTKEIQVKKKGRVVKNGPYLIPKIVSVLLACSLLTDRNLDIEYENHKKEKERYLNDLMELYYVMEEPFYMIPATRESDGTLTVYMDNNEYFDTFSDSSTDAYSFSEFIKKQENGLNFLLVPMTSKEFEMFRYEISINKEDLSLLENIELPEHIHSDRHISIDMSERLIDILNRKREEILLASEDLDGMNLNDLSNYISCTIQELIIREDDDYIDFIEQEEIKDAKEFELISKLDKQYTITPVYESQDKVEELINEQKKILETRHDRSEPNEELELY